MASEDVVGKRSESAVSTIVNLAEEAKLAREGVKAPSSYAVLSICKSLVAGGVAGGVSRTAVAPLERLKILLQVQNPHNIKYNGTVQGLKYIWRTEGLRGLFKGNGTNCARIVPNSAVKFFSYEQASKGILWLYQQQTGKEDAQLTPLLRLGAGACAGIIAMSATYPMDMVRGRLTVQTEKSPYQYRGMFHALSTVLREEGARALYKGWLPSVIGVIPYVGLNFAVYESLKDWLIKSRPFGLVEDSELSVVTRLACGAAAGTVGQTVAYPLDVVRRRMQMVGWKDAASIVTGDGKSKAPLEYTGMVDAFRKTVRHEGFGALYKGLVPNSVKGILTTLSQSNGGYKYDYATVPFLAEVYKLLVSSFLLWRECQTSPLPRMTTDWKSIRLYPIPSIIYLIHNNVQFATLTYVDTSTYQIMGNLKIVTTGILFRLFLRRKLSNIQWMAIVLLAVGTTTSQVKGCGEASCDSLFSAPVQGYMLGILSACLSALAGIYTEFLMKKNNDSLYWQNVQLYTFGSIFNMARLLLDDFRGEFENGPWWQRIFNGYTITTWLVMINLGSTGLLVSWLMKYADNIIKVYSTSMAMLLTMVLSVFLFEFRPTLQLFLGIIICMMSLHMYFAPPSMLVDLPSAVKEEAKDLIDVSIDRKTDS